MTKDNVSWEEKLLMGLGLFSIGLGLWEALAPSSVARATGLKRNRKLLRAFGAREMAAGAGILTQGAKGPWLQSRVAGDAMDLAVLGAGFASPRTNKTRLALATAAVAGVTALDIYCAKQFTKNRHTNGHAKGLGKRRISRSVIIDCPADQLYSFCMNHDNLSNCIKGVVSVNKISDNRSHWKATGPANTTIEWDAHVTELRPNELISWESVHDAIVLHRGSIRFEKAAGGRGTLLWVDLEYSPPGGVMAAKLARLFGQAPEQRIATALRQIKQYIETGEVARTEGQSAGRASSTSKLFDELVQK